MNQICVFGNTLSKVEFFDYTYDLFVEAGFCDDEDDVIYLEYKLCMKLLDVYGWTAEYYQWVDDGAGVNEAMAELAKLNKAFSEAK